MTNKSNKTVNIIGGGLAGCEATFWLAKHGYNVKLFEQKPLYFSPAHTNQNLAEIVCSNSLKSTELSSASGMLKAELEILDCSLLKIAKQCSVPAGSALAVDRELFAQKVTQEIQKLKNVEIVHQKVDSIDTKSPTIIATGPLTSGKLADEIQKLLGSSKLYFYDASAPIVDGQTLDQTKTFSAGRYDKGDSDYVNCPMNKEEYYAFVDALVSAKRVELKNFENVKVFEGCMPIEIMAARGKDTLRFGPLKPVGLTDDFGKRPFAVVQLRRESVSSQMYNLVGFQTNLLYPEQKRVFSMIPALANAEFVKYGVMHRNSYICAPKHITQNFNLRTNPNIYFAGQISGVEGYVESIMSGLVCAISMQNQLEGKDQIEWPATTMIGAITHYLVSADQENFQPMNANFGVLEPLIKQIKDKKERKIAYSLRGIEDMKKVAKKYNLQVIDFI